MHFLHLKPNSSDSFLRKFSQFSHMTTAESVGSINFSFSFTLASATGRAFSSPRSFFTWARPICQPYFCTIADGTETNWKCWLNTKTLFQEDDVNTASTFFFAFWSTSEAGGLVIQILHYDSHGVRNFQPCGGFFTLPKIFLCQFSQRNRTLAM